MTPDRLSAKSLPPSFPLAAAKAGAYGGIAVAAWLAGSVAAGHGVAAADTGGSSASGGGSASAHVGPRATGTAKARGSRTAKPSATTTSKDSAVPAAAKTAATLRTAPSTVPAAVTAHALAPDPLGVLNRVVTTLLDPFLKPPPPTPGPVVPLIWSALGAVRRDVFNQVPTISNPTTTVQTGQTVTGNIGAVDVEGDALKYTVTQGPKYGTLTIDQATGNYTYTPNDINYTAAQTDSFAVSVTDGKFNILAPLSARTATASENLTVLSPEVQRTILNLPSTITNPQIPRFTSDGKTILFSATPVAGGRSEIYSMSVSDTDGSTVTCVTCGVTPTEGSMSKVVPSADGSGRFVVLVGNRWDVYEPATDTATAQLVKIVTPASGSTAVDPQREMRISPDGKYVLFSQIQLGSGGNITAVPVVGKLVRYTNATTGAPEYHIDDARVVYPVGEGKQWTPDGKGVIILGGSYEAGNVDDIVVDLATGAVTRLTGNLDYDEDTDMSPNQQWIAIGSTRGFDALTPMSRIVRPAFLPAYIQGTVYQAYATPINVSNQEWLVAIQDDLKGENGIPLFAAGDGCAARSMPSWNADGTAITFWESSISSSQTRLVVANLKYTTSVGTVQGDRVTPNADWAPALATYKSGAAPLPAVGAYIGAGGGTAFVSEAPDPTNSSATIRTVTYTNYVNEDGMILNGTESTTTTASQASIRYQANIVVTGAHTGSLTGDATINKLTRTMTGNVTSVLDGSTLVLLDPTRIQEAQQGA